MPPIAAQTPGKNHRLRKKPRRSDPTSSPPSLSDGGLPQKAFLSQSLNRAKTPYPGYIPPYCPHLNPIERLWGLMHKHMTHNRCYSTFREFCTALLSFLREDVPRNWRSLCDSVSDNFRVIDPDQFRVLT